MDKRIEGVKVFLLWMTKEYPKYANPENYIPKDDLCQHEMDLDQGHRARKALGDY